MKKFTGMILALVICLLSSVAMAGNWDIPRKKTSTETSTQNSTVRVKTKIVVDSIATRSGPSQKHTGCATMINMKDRNVVALSRGTDTSGICWIEIEVEYYSGAPRRCWVGAERLALSDEQLDRLPPDYEYALGEGVINQKVVSRMGPGATYVVNKDYSYAKGDPVEVIASDGDYYIVESYVNHPKTGEELILRSWVPAACVTMK